MWKKDYSELVSKLYSGEVISKVRFSALRVAIMAAATSSAFSGIIIGVPLINRAGKLLGIGLSEMLLEELSKTCGDYISEINDTGKLTDTVEEQLKIKMLEFKESLK